VVDRCPDRFGSLANDGCPDPDSDHDGYIDRVDKCPLEPETWNGVDDDDGCPDRGPLIASLTVEGIALHQPINFLESSSVLESRSAKVLEVVAKMLNLHQELTRVRIEGHTDNRGSAVTNLDLSLARAIAVRRWLVEHGNVDGGRLLAQGFGGDRPIADNRDQAGRMRNRRIEIKIVERRD
jgi:outer membrane protein OmpA-like peptidoglycan-associated protein